MKPILVGSRAMRHWFPNFREPHDTDWLFHKAMPQTDGRVETFWDQAIEDNYEWLADNCVAHEDYLIATDDFLYTLKVSHAFWTLKNGSWRKHMNDIRWLQMNTDVRFDHSIYEIFYPIWEKRYGKKRANLNVSAEDFFTKTVDRTYDHDSIHASVAYYHRPLFNEILRLGSDVAVSRDRFNALSMEKKLRLVREECYATALERQIIPSDYKYPPNRAYRWALMKTITSFSKGWFPLFIVLNYSKLTAPDVDYVKVHRDNAEKLVLL